MTQVSYNTVSLAVPQVGVVGVVIIIGSLRG
jgi:hypothetical protein